ncbi:hypothetical protein JKP88DRAFT_290073 [Tribonema minus]|uniref:Uncharacterized protein n=1 Tax=Tribonema minus TaxID=303371 RepID=A0A835YYN8_9STRA|nr:hypothetical protein JKP88DRAFT_290073 [Tribonema minus]
MEQTALVAASAEDIAATDDDRHTESLKQQLIRYTARKVTESPVFSQLQDTTAILADSAVALEERADKQDDQLADISAQLQGIHVTIAGQSVVLTQQVAAYNLRFSQSMEELTALTTAAAHIAAVRNAAETLQASEQRALAAAAAAEQHAASARLKDRNAARNSLNTSHGEMVARAAKAEQRAQELAEATAAKLDVKMDAIASLSASMKQFQQGLLDQQRSQAVAAEASSVLLNDTIMAQQVQIAELTLWQQRSTAETPAIDPNAGFMVQGQQRSARGRTTTRGSSLSDGAAPPSNSRFEVLRGSPSPEPAVNSNANDDMPAARGGALPTAAAANNAPAARGEALPTTAAANNAPAARGGALPTAAAANNAPAARGANKSPPPTPPHLELLEDDAFLGDSDEFYDDGDSDDESDGAAPSTPSCSSLAAAALTSSASKLRESIARCEARNRQLELKAPKLEATKLEQMLDQKAADKAAATAAAAAAAAESTATAAAAATTAAAAAAAAAQGARPQRAATNDGQIAALVAAAAVEEMTAAVAAILAAAAGGWAAPGVLGAEAAGAAVAEMVVAAAAAAAAVAAAVVAAEAAAGETAVIPAVWRDQ